MSDDLKPCPFCGGEAVYAERHNTGATADWCGQVQHWVGCFGECGASTCMHDTKAEAFAAWNTRAETADRIEALTAENERLRETLQRIKQITSRSDNDYTVCPDCMDIETETRAALNRKETAETFTRSDNV